MRVLLLNDEFISIFRDDPWSTCIWSKLSSLFVLETPLEAGGGLELPGFELLTVRLSLLLLDDAPMAGLADLTVVVVAMVLGLFYNGGCCNNRPL